MLKGEERVKTSLSNHRLALTIFVQTELNGEKKQNIRAIPPLEIQRTGKVATIIFLGLKSLCIELYLLESGFEFSYF